MKGDLFRDRRRARLSFRPVLESLEDRSLPDATSTGGISGVASTVAQSMQLHAAIRANAQAVMQDPQTHALAQQLLTSDATALGQASQDVAGAQQDLHQQVDTLVHAIYQAVDAAAQQGPQALQNLLATLQPQVQTDGAAAQQATQNLQDLQNQVSQVGGECHAFGGALGQDLSQQLTGQTPSSQSSSNGPSTGPTSGTGSTSTQPGDPAPWTHPPTPPPADSPSGTDSSGTSSTGPQGPGGPPPFGPHPGPAQGAPSGTDSSGAVGSSSGTDSSGTGSTTSPTGDPAPWAHSPFAPPLDSSLGTGSSTSTNTYPISTAPTTV